ncbi:biopolymer transporter ExbD [Francisellaceae bacterium]|nr:biopolymer transporter ExbD [Francisellaceae bacterium]
MVTSLKQSISDKYAEEPNLIPLLDFILVLLIMFVLLAGPIQKVLKLPLPEVKEGASNQKSNELIVISVKNEKELYVGDVSFSNLQDFESHLTESYSNSQNEIVLNATKALPLEVLLKIFSITKKLGIKTANIQVAQK